jgi:ssRNA-specific RNase YbeY (16S rRNA maturation enzyme)
VVHGLLHLCGFDDHEEADARRMRRREIELLAEAGVTDPYNSYGSEPWKG